MIIIYLFYFFVLQVYPGSSHQMPYPMPQPGGHNIAPYPAAPGGYGDHNQAPPPGFNMGYNQSPPPVMYQPGPVSGPEYGGQMGGITPAPVAMPAGVPVGVPPGLEYLTQVGRRRRFTVRYCYTCFRDLHTSQRDYASVTHQLQSH